MDFIDLNLTIVHAGYQWQTFINITACKVDFDIRYTNNALMQLVNDGSCVIRFLQQLCIISVQVMTEMKSVDEFYKLFHQSGGYLGSQNTAWGTIKFSTQSEIETAEHHDGTCCLCSTSEVKTEPGQSWTSDDKAMGVIAHHVLLYRKPSYNQEAPAHFSPESIAHMMKSV